MTDTPNETNIEYYERKAREWETRARQSTPGTAREFALDKAEWCRDQAERERDLERQAARLVGWWR